MMTDVLATHELSTAWQLGSERQRVLVLAVSAGILSLLVTALILGLELMSVVIVATWLTLIAIAWRPRVGLYVLFTLVLLFESQSPDPLMAPGRYLSIAVAGMFLSPLEILLLLTFVLWLGQGVARRHFGFRSGRLLWPGIFFVVALIFGLVRGVGTGGDLRIALFEARSLFYLIFCYLLAANTLRTVGHMRVLATLMLAGGGLFALEGVYRGVTMVRAGQLSGDLVYEHPDVIFLGTLILFVLAQHVCGAPRWQRLLGVLVLPIAIFALLATERRAGFIAVMVGFLVFAMVFSFVRRKAFFLVVVPILVAGAIYMPLFWNSTSTAGQPARAVRSLVDPNRRDAASNEYRDLERINVAAGIASSPLLGLGFGQPFPFVVPLPDLSWWEFWHYEPHHNVLWVWLKTGALGFGTFFVLMGTAIASAAHAVKTLRDPDLRSIAFLVLAGVITTLVFSYVDLGLTSGRVTVFLGTLLGTVDVLDRIDA